LCHTSLVWSRIYQPCFAFMGPWGANSACVDWKHSTWKCHRNLCFWEAGPGYNKRQLTVIWHNSAANSSNIKQSCVRVHTFVVEQRLISTANVGWTDLTCSNLPCVCNPRGQFQVKLNNAITTEPTSHRKLSASTTDTIR
jgi:hypothetical protein